MAFIPHTEAEVAAMLAVIGVSSIEDLFDEIPPALRVRSLAGMLTANVINLALGVVWLSGLVGQHRAVGAGFMPFWIGGLIKAGMATATILMARKRIRQRAPTR